MQHIAATAVDQLPRLVVAEARVLPSAHGLCSRSLCDNRSRRGRRLRLACCLGAVRSLCPLGHVSPWRAIHPPTPGGRHSSPEPPRLATDARRGLGVQPLRTNCRGAGRPRRPNRPPRPRVAVQAMADGSPGGGRARLVGTLQVGSDICTSKFIYKGLLCLTRGGWAAASARAADALKFLILTAVPCYLG